jgi:hypothetical protein
MTDVVPDHINTASDVSLARANTTSVPSEIDGIVPGGTFWEDPFGGMTLDEEIAGQQVGVVATRPGSLDNMSFAPVGTQQYSVISGGRDLQETPSPLHNVQHLAGQANMSQGTMQPTKVIKALPHLPPTQRLHLLTHPINTFLDTFVFS